jgi:3-oxoacyl-[acyl-carrier-protein] synthase III
MRYCAIEYAIPSKVVTNTEIVQEIISRSKRYLTEKALGLLETNLNELFQKSVTSVRFHRAKNEKAIQFGIEAGRKALESANISPDDIDLLIYVGVGRGYIEPATANVFQKILKLKRATCFDILDACASWLRAIHVAHSFIKTGMYKNIMIMNCEFNFREYANFEFKSLKDIEFNFPTFTIGEAATATIVTESHDDDQYYASFRTWGDQHNLCKIPLPHFSEYSDGELRNGSEIPPLTFFSYGEKIFRFVFSRLCRHYREDAVLNQFNHEIVFSHAASDAMSDKVIESCKLGEGKGYNTHKRFGNTVSASVPLAMGCALKDGRLKNGTNVLVGFGSAGVSTAWSKFRFLT